MTHSRHQPTFSEAIEGRVRAQVKREQTPSEVRSSESRASAREWVALAIPEAVGPNGYVNGVFVGAALTLRWLHGPENVTAGMVRERVERTMG